MGWRRWGSGALIGLVCACNGETGRDQPDGSPPGTRADAAEVDAAPMPPDAGEPDAAHPDAAHPDAAPPDAGHADAAPDAGPGGMVIASIVLDGGFSQARHGATIELVISGSGLGEVTDVAFEDGLILFPGDLIVTPTEVRAVVFIVNEAAPGPRDVTVVSATESATELAVFEVTPWVFGPGAAPGGRATFESPLALAEYIEGASTGNTLLFLAGEHRSDGRPFIDGSVTITGEGADTTIIRGVDGSFGGFDAVEVLGAPEPSSLRDLTIVTDGAFPGYRFVGFGALEVSDVSLVGGGISVLGEPGVSVTVVRLDFDGEGSGASGLRAAVDRVDVEITDSRFADCGAGNGIAMEQAAGRFTADNILVEGCAVGILVSSVELDVSVTSSQFIDNATGLDLFAGMITLSELEIADNEATLQASEVGIRILSGRATVSDALISGQDQRGFQALSFFDRPFNVSLERLDIAGGEIGVESSGASDDNFLGMRDCVVHDQTVASLSVDNDESLFDFGNDGLGGGNQLSVSSGIAFQDLRDDPFISFRTISAQGMTLNGNSYENQLIEGPVDGAPDYFILANGSLQF